MIKFKVNFFLSSPSKVSKGSGGYFEVIESEIKRKSQPAPPHAPARHVVNIWGKCEFLTKFFSMYPVAVLFASQIVFFAETNKPYS